MSTIIDETDYAPTGLGRLVLLLAAPAVALAVMAGLALQEGTPRSQPEPVTSASVTVSVTPAAMSPGHGQSYTLYIMSGPDDVQRVRDLSTRDSLLDWYATVSTQAEEFELMRQKDEADWFRYASGLPPIRVVDLRLTAAGSPSDHVARD